MTPEQELRKEITKFLSVNYQYHKAYRSMICIKKNPNTPLWANQQNQNTVETLYQQAYQMIPTLYMAELQTMLQQKKIIMSCKY